MPAIAPDIVHPRDLRVGELSPVVGDPQYPWHLLAEGDSWFSIGALPSSNLLYELRLKRWAQVFNIAYPGDTLRRVADLAANRDLSTWLAKPNFATHFDALLLSAGGNDLIAAAPRLLRSEPAAGALPDDPAAYVDAQALAALLSDLRDGIARIVALRDSEPSASRGAPLFVHTYDYLTPRNAPARFLNVPTRGPWLYPVLVAAGVNAEMRQRVARLLVDALADTLLSLALPAVHVVDTRNTLAPADPASTGSSGDWLNEIHPTPAGYRKIAARLSDAIDETLG
jgi:lysophospholipase L1-like esterase